MIQKEDLQPGDILLYEVTHHSGILAWFIAWAQNIIGKNPAHLDAYSHISMIDNDTDYLLEARWPKTKRTKIDFNRLNRKYDIQVWRVKNVTQNQIEVAIKWCYDHLGEWYDLGLFIWGVFDFKNAEICSTFIAKAWQDAGIFFKVGKAIAGNKFFWSPDEISWNTTLIQRIK